jgi:large subunit ribosomal protein L5
MSDMYKKYKELVPELQKTLGLKNIMEVPKLQKIVISTGIGTKNDKDAFGEAVENIALITGQKPVITKAKKNVAGFKIRVGMNSGVMVTLRGSRMWEFLDRWVHNTLPRVRDFRGVSPKGFDGRGNYSVGMDDITAFTEVDMDKLKRQLGINLTFVTSAKTNEEGLELLKMLEVPFAK